VSYTALVIASDLARIERLSACMPADWASESTPSPEEALERLGAGGVDLAFVDYELPGLSAGSFLTQVRTVSPWTPILLVAPAGSRAETVPCLALGATDLVFTPLIPDEVHTRVACAMSRFPQQRPSPLTKAEEAVLVGPSPAMLGIREQVAIVAPTEIPVLLLGESGTGRGVIARQIHYQSARAKGPFIVVNCSGVPDHLLESEFFGQASPEPATQGQLAEAAGGSLFFDEVADLPLAFQAKLIKIMRDREYSRLGAPETQVANARFIFACSRDLASEVTAKRFREDLYYRIQTFPLRVPPMRERTEDIPVLARAFMQNYCRELGKPFEGFEDEAIECLLWYPWPGNVRELQTRMRFCALYFSGPKLRREDLPFELQGPVGRSVGSYAHARMQFEREYLVRLLRKHQGNINRMAAESGKQRVEIYRMLRRCGLSADKFRSR
jgi:DNA-binding NtrC family response regulator